MPEQLDVLWLEEIEPHTDGKIIRYLRKHHEGYQDLQKKQEKLLRRYPVLISVINNEDEITLKQEEHHALKTFMTVRDEMDSIVMEYNYFFGQTSMLNYIEMLNDLYHKVKHDNEKEAERCDTRMPIPYAEEKALLETTLNGLKIYAEEAAQDMWEPLRKIRKVVKEMSSYWDMQGEKDWEQSFDNHVLLSYFDQKAEPISEEEKIKVIQGLRYYMEEMNCTHGQEAAERILEIRDLITEMDSRWKFPTEQMKETYEKLERITGDWKI